MPIDFYRDLPIAIFDSGVGGLTVMRSIIERLPNENILYFGDTAHLPYGNKSRERVLELTLQNCQFLLDQGVKALVIACHTATCIALDSLKRNFSLPVFGMVDALRSTLDKQPQLSTIALLATRATLSSGVYQQELLSRYPRTQLFPIAAPLLVSLAEEGFTNHALTDLALSEYLSSANPADLDAIILGCTHFPLIKTALQRQLPTTTAILDPSQACAELVQQALRESGLLREASSAPQFRFVVSDQPQHFQTTGSRFLGREISSVYPLSTFVDPLHFAERS